MEVEMKMRSDAAEHGEENRERAYGGLLIALRPTVNG